MCYKTLSHLDYDLWLEPSAGTGSFFSLLPNNKRLGYDIDPKYTGIKQMDFMDIRFNLPKQNNIITIGNPPFGYRAQGAIEFFNEAAIYSNTIAFIVPRSFRKAYIINQLNSYFHLEQEILLDVDVFDPSTLTRCIWIVYNKKSFKRDKIILPNSHKDFTIVKQGKGFNVNDADFGIRRTGFAKVGEVLPAKDCKPITQFIFIKNGDVEIFKQLDLSCAFDTALSPTFTQGELIEAYTRLKNDNN